MITPSGYINSREMFDVVGRELFGDDWTGSVEYRVRQNLYTREEIEWSKTAPGISAGGDYNRPPGWVGPWVGWVLRPQIEGMGTDEYEAERVARIRYEAALSEFLKRLEAGQVRAAALNTDTGRIYPIGAEVWHTNRARDYLARGKGPAGYYYRNRTQYFHEGTLLIERAAIADPVTPPPQMAVVNGPEPRKRGPKTVERNRVKAEMLKFGLDEVDSWSEEAMSEQFNANRGTCRKALAELRSELANK
jgi:hypothetical protein